MNIIKINTKEEFDKAITEGKEVNLFYKKNGTHDFEWNMGRLYLSPIETTDFFNNCANFNSLEEVINYILPPKEEIEFWDEENLKKIKNKAEEVKKDLSRYEINDDKVIIEVSEMSFEVYDRECFYLYVDSTHYQIGYLEEK